MKEKNPGEEETVDHAQMTMFTYVIIDELLSAYKWWFWCCDDNDRHLKKTNGNKRLELEWCKRMPDKNPTNIRLKDYMFQVLSD